MKDKTNPYNEKQAAYDALAEAAGEVHAAGKMRDGWRPRCGPWRVEPGKRGVRMAGDR